jgi:ribonuclease P protein component
MPRPGDGETVIAPAAETPRSVALRLKKRADFLAAAKGRRQHQRCFVLQARERPEAVESERRPVTADSDAARFGFTVTKKVGNSVIRNRIRRRLREALRLADLSLPKAHHDYVLVARIEALTAPFEDLRGEIARALTKIHLTKIHTPKIKPAGLDSRPPAAPAADRKQDD